jgi:hypothetical protein
MGPAIELFLLLLFGLAVVIGGLLFFTRPFWKRAIKTVVDTDRQERSTLEEQARERAHEAECRRRAEEELQRALKGEDVPGSAPRKPPAKTQGETNMKFEETKTEQIQTEERK